MPRNARPRRGPRQCLWIDITHVNQLDTIGMLLDGTEMVVGYPATADQGEANPAIDNRGVVVHGQPQCRGA